MPEIFQSLLAKLAYAVKCLVLKSHQDQVLVTNDLEMLGEDSWFIIPELWTSMIC